METAQKKLVLIKSASAKTKRSVLHSHHLVECLDELEDAKRELCSCQVFHNKASTTSIGFLRMIQTILKIDKM